MSASHGNAAFLTIAMSSSHARRMCVRLESLKSKVAKQAACGVLMSAPCLLWLMRAEIVWLLVAANMAPAPPVTADIAAGEGPLHHRGC